jgi:hypothetical protein
MAVEHGAPFAIAKIDGFHAGSCREIYRELANIRCS